MPHPVSKNLCSTSRHRIHSRSLHPLQRLGNCHLAALGQKRHLHHRERLDMHLGKPLLQPPHQIYEVLKRQIGVQSPNDMELRHRLRVTARRRLPRLFQGHGVGTGGVLLASEGTQAARGNAYVGGIDVPVDVEVRLVAV